MSRQGQAPTNRTHTLKQTLFILDCWRDLTAAWNGTTPRALADYEPRPVDDYPGYPGAAKYERLRTEAAEEAGDILEALSAALPLAVQILASLKLNSRLVYDWLDAQGSPAGDSFTREQWAFVRGEIGHALLILEGEDGDGREDDERRGQEDNSADRSKKNRKYFPDNHLVKELADRINTNCDEGESKNAIARSFAAEKGMSEADGLNLLRELRPDRYGHLLHKRRKK